MCFPVRLVAKDERAYRRMGVENIWNEKLSDLELVEDSEIAEHGFRPEKEGTVLELFIFQLTSETRQRKLKGLFEFLHL